jgi:hypothetical protein
MTASRYLAIAKVAFIVLVVNPIVLDPVMLPSSRLQSTKNVRLHELAKKNSKLYHGVNEAICN